MPLLDDKLTNDLLTSAAYATPGTMLFGLGSYAGSKADQLSATMRKWLESFNKIPGITSRDGVPIHAGTLLGKDEAGKDIFNTLKSGISNLKTLHPASTTDAAAEAYARGSQELLNMRVGPLKAKHFKALEHNLAALKSSPFLQGSSYKDKPSRSNLFQRLTNILKHPSSVMSDKGLLSEAAAAQLAFNKEHYGAYANKDLSDPKSLKWLATHQYKDIAEEFPDGIRTGVTALYDEELPASKSEKAVRKILSDYSTSYTEKEKLINNLGLHPKSVEARLADAILHGVAPSQGNRGKAGGTGLFKSNLEGVDAIQGGASRFIHGARDHSSDILKLIRNLKKLSRKAKGTGTGLLGAGLIASILNTASDQMA